MDFEPNTEQNDWITRIQQFLVKNDLENAMKSESERLPWHIRELAGQENLIGLDVPKEDGGHGVSDLTMGHIYEVCGRFGLNTRELFGAGHGRLIANYGTKEQKEKYLPPLMRGEILIGAGLTEPTGGSDVGAFQTTAKRVGSSYIISGEKEWVNRIREAKVFVVFAKTDQELGAKGLSAFIVEMNDPKIKKYEYEALGLKGFSYGGFELDDVVVPTENLLGEEGQGFAIVNQHFNFVRNLVALISIGSAQMALEQAIDFAKSRQAFGGPIGRFHSVMHKISEGETTLEAARLLAYKSLVYLDKGKPNAKEAYMAKWFGTTSAYKVIDDALQIHGARGYIKDYGLEQRLRDVRAFLIADGSTEVMKSVLGRELLGKEVYNASYGRVTPKREKIV
ncbi:MULTISPECIES: acyl-CoA dehydrogenase family protein [Virgibacillus]|uniref:Medium-chain specific acyl-CoA dehydrogenase, mitochondrial n=1 Tax=Virgibacillus dokdonensis TaxID=302167 RepID=A0A2K9J2Q9_9BACI|nr:MULTISPECIES: acyl-CoA dehydrogenase family protein [Virgibacillus]AUJ25323.1 Acyl-CoA dehydrogenase [Virgibacillus dokdonensis]NWO12507.1 acyl-CoA/acyl-ACP dehydrogenase [Virgibacillus sp.]